MLRTLDLPRNTIVDITSLESMQQIFRYSPFANNEPISAMLLGYASFKFTENALKNIENGDMLSKKQNSLVCVGFAKTHMVFVFIKEISNQQFMTEKVLFVNNKSYSNIVVGENKKCKIIEFHMGLGNNIITNFYKGKDFEYQNNLLNKLYAMCKRKYFMQ